MTDDWQGYARIGDTGRTHSSVSHSGPKSTWAQDEDADGVREVHVNTIEGFWQGLRNFLRRFRGEI